MDEYHRLIRVTICIATSIRGENMRHLRFWTVLTVIALLTINSIPSTAKEMYHLIFIPNPSPTTILTMAELGLPLDDSRTIKGEGLEIPLEAADIALLDSRGIQYNIIQEDLEKYYGEICRKNLENIPPKTDDDPVHMKYGSMGGFYTFQEIVFDLDSMYLLYPNICTEKEILGYGWDDYPIYVVKISDNPATFEGEPEGLFDGLHHAREPGAYTAIIYAMWYLLENYGTDEEVTYLVDNRELYFVPVVNPDGLIYNQTNNPNGGGMWRKNRRNNGGSYGVDLNRNYSYQWGYNNSGSSPTPSSSTYRGPYAASEPETQAMINFINDQDIHTAMTIHSNSGVYITAYGYANVLPEHYDVHMEYLAYAAVENGYGYGTCYQVMYSSNGRTQDWQLHEHDIINVEPEIGSSSFWPPIGEIMPTSAEQLRISLHLYWCAGGKVEFSSIEVQDEFLTPGDTENLIATVFNKGWGTSEPVDYEISTTDPFITITTNTASTDSILKRTGADNSANPFTAEVDSTCPIGHQAGFTLTLDQGGYIRTAEFSLIVGEPEIFFQDDAEAGMGNWTSTGGWGLSSNNPHGGQYSFTESPGGNYGNNVTAIMTLNQPVNLTIATSLWLEFWTRWDIESNYDFGQVEVSSNGITWTPLQGIYTQPGAGQGVQPSGQPGYEGTQVSWVQEHMNIDQYAGIPTFYLRYEFKSDGGVVGDGWNVDDIKLMGFTEPIPPPDVTVTLTPENPPIVIPANGGSFNFNIAGDNNGTSPAAFDVWTYATLPNGTQYGPIIFVSNFTLAAGAAVERDRTQAVPANAPSGDYTYDAYLGLYPNIVWDEDHFDFEKLADSDGGPLVPDWNNWGESFDELSGDASSVTPDKYELGDAYPNPFNPETHLSFTMPVRGKVSLLIYDITGREVAVLAEGWYSAGLHNAVFDGSSLASGVYFASFKAGDCRQVRKMVLMK